jgi:hypothetical protein
MNAMRAIFLTSPWARRISIVLFALLAWQSVARGQRNDTDPEFNILSDTTGTAWGRGPYTRKSPSTGPLPTVSGILPHAGEYLATETNYYEIVYMPLQTRIYLYDRNFRPIGAQNVRAAMSLQLPWETALRRVPFQFVPLPAGATEQDFAVAPLDVRPLQDKEISITFELSAQSNTTTLTPHYDHFKIRPYVAQAALTAADQDAISRQRICPVTGAPLGSRGPVVKLYVAEFPLYLSGPDCIAAVSQAPQRFLPQTPLPPPTPPTAPLPPGQAP